MGPRSDERGNFPVKSGERPWQAASMGPRSDERGNEAVHVAGSRKTFASMGPRSDERGNEARLPAAPPVRWLQWGRAQMSAEMAQYPITQPVFLDFLQWGRAQMSAEIMVILRTKIPGKFPSMGPRSDERGNETTAQNGCAISIGLQCGRAQMSAEMRNRAVAGDAARWPFNGAALR